MKYNQLQIKKQRTPNRVGRGISAGQGKTAGRGTKGQGARKSPGRAGFEGGQTPLSLRLPKLRGFKSHRAPTEEVYTGQLDDIKKPTIDNAVLAEAGLITTAYGHAKLVLKGEVKTKKDIKLQAATATAIAAVKKAGGSFASVERQARPKATKPAESR